MHVDGFWMYGLRRRLQALEVHEIYSMGNARRISLRELNRIIPKLSSKELPHLTSRTARDASISERRL
jgi:hypothetical protein